MDRQRRARLVCRHVLRKVGKSEDVHTAGKVEQMGNSASGGKSEGEDGDVGKVFGKVSEKSWKRR